MYQLLLASNVLLEKKNHTDSGVKLGDKLVIFLTSLSLQNSRSSTIYRTCLLPETMVF